MEYLIRQAMRDIKFEDKCIQLETVIIQVMGIHRITNKNNTQAVHIVYA